MTDGEKLRLAEVSIDLMGRGEEVVVGFWVGLIQVLGEESAEEIRNIARGTEKEVKGTTVH